MGKFISLRFLNQLVRTIRLRDYSIRTEHTYVNWLCRYIAYYANQSPDSLNESYLLAFPGMLRDTVRTVRRDSLIQELMSEIRRKMATP